MARPRLLVDKTELVCIIVGKKKATTKNITYDRITNITIEPYTVTKFLFIKKPSERIVFTLAGMDKITYVKEDEKQFFEGYKKEIRDFAKRNRVTLYDKTEAQ